MQHSGLSDQTLPISHVSTRALVATAVNGTAVDMQGWDGVEFTVQFGVFGTNGTLDVGPVQTDDNSGFNSPANVANSSLVQIPAANANGIAIVDVYKPNERYVRLQVLGQTNGVTAGVVARQYRHTGILPPTASAQQTLKLVLG
jgi:hypothetical protein